MAYQYKNNMNNQYNELTPAQVDIANMNYGSMPSMPSVDASMPVTPIIDAPAPMDIGDFSTSGWDTQSGAAPQWGDMNKYMGDGLKGIYGDGFQMQDLGATAGLAGDYLNFGKDKIMGSGVGQAGSDMWNGMDNAGKFSTVMGGIKTLGGLYSSYKGFQMAKDQQAMQKDMWNKTWDANKKQFNESVESRAAGKYNSQASQGQKDDYQKKYSI